MFWRKATASPWQRRPGKTKIFDGDMALLGKGSRKYAIFTLNREGKKQPDFCEIDTVSRDGGGEVSAHYPWTLTVTDADLGWTESACLRTKPGNE